MSKKILVRTERDPLFGLTPNETIEYLRKALEGRAEEAYLYGSFGTGDFNRHSDIDLIIVCNTDAPFVERGNAFADLRQKLPSIEALVYTPEEFTSLTADPTAGFWRTVTATMRRIM